MMTGMPKKSTTTASNTAPLVERVDQYLHAHPGRANTVTSAGPLGRRVQVSTRTWIPWITLGGKPGSKSACGPLPAEVSAAASAALEALDDVEGRVNVSHRDKVVTRSHLVKLSALAATRQDSNLITLWVATMMWGSGTTNGRGPWRTAQGLSAPNLVVALQASSDAVRRRDLVSAYRGFALAGCGSSFFTKWFWAVALAQPDQPLPLILDERVLNTLRWIHQGTDWRSPRHAEGYQTYVEMIHNAANELRVHHGGLDAEKLEWMLFDRTNGPDGPSFKVWLSSAPSHRTT